MSTTENAYVPGVCNINYDEIAYRRKAGHIGLAIFAVVLLPLIFTGLSRYYRVILFLPALLSALGYLQARNRFCVGYASAGQQNASEGNKQAVSIDNQAAISADKRKARQLYAQAFVIALVATVIAVSIPHL